jgi:hypothetical protein
VRTAVRRNQTSFQVAFDVTQYLFDFHLCPLRLCGKILL